MDTQSFAVIALFVLIFGTFSARLQRTSLTAPMAFVLFGILISPNILGWASLSTDSQFIVTLAELTLIIVLFVDASQLNVKDLDKQLHLPLRLLCIAMPLSIILGTITALYFFDFLWIWQAIALAAILSPTDAALGQVVVTSPKVPSKIKKALNVESGLNDGIALPIIVIALAISGVMEAEKATEDLRVFFSKQLLLSPVIGTGIGFLFGELTQIANKKGWINSRFQQLSIIAIALLTYSTAEILQANGFIATFCCGLWVGNLCRSSCQKVYEFGEGNGELLSLITFIVFGDYIIWTALDSLNWSYVIYGLLSLTLIRMIPVAVSMIGTGFSLKTVLYLGWFGPRGIASILFALLVLNRTELDVSDEIYVIVVITVFMSIFLHGITAWPWTKWFSDSLTEKEKKQLN